MSRDWHRRSQQSAPYALTPLVVIAALPAIGPGPWLTLTVAGLTMGIMLFMVAAGLTLIFGLMDVLNFAHAAFVAVGAYIAPVEITDGGKVEPGNLREQIRRSGVTIGLPVQA